MKQSQYIKIVLYNDGYTTNESLSGITLISLTSGGTLRYKQSGTTNIVEDTIAEATGTTFNDVVGSLSVSGSTAISVTVATGATHTYQIRVVDENNVLTTGLTYSSSNPTIATVNGTGLITGVSIGTTIITVGVANDTSIQPITIVLNVTVTN